MKRTSGYSSISTKILLFCLGAILVPMGLLLGYITCRYSRYIQEEMSKATVRRLLKSQDDFYEAFWRMVNIARVISNDEALQQALLDEEVSRYEKTLRFNESVATISVNNIYEMDKMKICCFDRNGEICANWSTNYHDYRFLYEQPWVRDSIGEKGYGVWSFFEPSYIYEEGEDVRYVSMARSILTREGGYAGTLIISMPQEVLIRDLSGSLSSPQDVIYICTETGQVKMAMDQQEIFDQERIRELAMAWKREPDSRIIKEKGHRYLLSGFVMENNFASGGDPMTILHFVYYDSVTRNLNALSRRTGIVIAVFMAILCAGVFWGTRMMTRPLEILADKMEKYHPQEEIRGIDLDRKDEIGHLNRSFQRMSRTIEELFEKQKAETKERERYRYEALRAQVNPHFLFNVLNSLRWMAIIENAGNMVECIDALTTILKYSMSRGGEQVSLRQEVESIDAYIFINNCRYGNRFRFETRLAEETLDLSVIKFILQPIIENSILHGFNNSGKKGRILLYGGEEEGLLKLYIEDNGSGITQEDLESPKKTGKKITGIGVDNVNSRIQTEYGEDYGIKIYNSPSGGAVVEYTLPVIRE